MAPNAGVALVHTSGTVPIFAQRKWDCPLPKCLILASLFLVLFAFWAAAARADEPSGPALTPGVQSIGKRGAALRWMPYRPEAGGYVERAAATERVAARLAPASPLPTGPRTTAAMADPFGDMRAQAEQPIAPDPLAEPKLPAKLEEPPRPPFALPPSRENGLPKIPEAKPSDTLSALGPGQLILGVPCPSPKDIFKPIQELNTDTTPLIPSEAPTAAKDGQKEFRAWEHDAEYERKHGIKIPKECVVAEKDVRPNELRCFAPTTFTWKASGLCHKPLYFEDVHLERYGHSIGPVLQPIVSGGHFFLSVPFLPYKMGLTPPHECMYTLGYYRPGSCAPYMLDPLPLSIRAGLLEAGVVTGLAFALP